MKKILSILAVAMACLSATPAMAYWDYTYQSWFSVTDYFGNRYWYAQCNYTHHRFGGYGYFWLPHGDTVCPSTAWRQRMLFSTTPAE